MAEETITEQVHQGQQWLERLLDLAGMPAPVQVDTSRLETEGSCWLIIGREELSDTQVENLLGNRGHALDAIQYLANTTLNMGGTPDTQCAYTIELDGYRARRQVELEAIAQAAVDEVRSSGEEHEIRDLSSAERRQVHTMVKAYDDVTTESRGREPDRRLVVKLKSSEEQ
ncbi:MAG: R3H domain-containing nucleic acid-binding protein [Cyanobacteria bacterium P01_A01_bin.135]